MPIVSALDFYNQIQKLDQINWDELNTSLISPNFSWYEVFKTATSQEVKACQLFIFQNAEKQSIILEEIRRTFGKAVVVHCWYRSPAHNALVGGKAGSYHLKGLATDFHIGSMVTIKDNLQVQRTLDPLPFMQDKGLEFTNGDWTHVDSRGYKARFNNH